MKLLLLMRHGDAPQEKSDKDRMLSELGRDQCLEMSEYLEEPDVSEVISSDYQRAIDSAKLVLPSANKLFKQNTSELLRPMADSKKAFNFILNEMENIPDQSALLVVCHMPIIAELAALAVDGAVNNRLSFPCASIMCLQSDLLGQGGFDLVWQKNPTVS